MSTVFRPDRRKYYWRYESQHQWFSKMVPMSITSIRLPNWEGCMCHSARSSLVGHNDILFFSRWYWAKLMNHMPYIDCVCIKILNGNSQNFFFSKYIWFREKLLGMIYSIVNWSCFFFTYLHQQTSIGMKKESHPRKTVRCNYSSMP